MNSVQQPINAPQTDAQRQSPRLPRPLPLLAATLLLMAAAVTMAHGTERSRDSWAVLGGYGESQPRWGGVNDRVRTIDIVGRYHYLPFAPLGSGWSQGDFSLLCELPVHFVLTPEESLMIGVNVLLCYTFTANRQWQPSLFAGAGPVYSFTDIDGMGAELNGNLQAGVGLEHPISATQSLLFEVRYHHISNAGTEHPNEPVNSIKFLIGFKF